MNWTLFWDMHSGGDQKEEFSKIYIEAPIDEAKVVFYNRFGHNPERVTCTCCGEDYSIDESKTLEEASAYHRGCKWSETGYRENGKFYVSVEEYSHNPDVCIIYSTDIKPSERYGDIPQQGFIWVGE